MQGGKGSLRHLPNIKLIGQQARSYGDFSPTTQLAAVTLTSDPLALKLVHGVLVSQGSFLPSLVFVGLFVFPLGGGTGQTDGQDQHMMGHPSRKDGPITNDIVKAEHFLPFKNVILALLACLA